MSRKLIDLSGPLESGMWDYGMLAGLAGRVPGFGVRQFADIPTDGFEAFEMRLTSLSGSYIETARHMLPRGPVLSDLPLERFVLPAVVCHLPEAGVEGVVRRSDLDAHCPPVEPGDALLIECGWGSHWRASDYVTGSPSFHIDCRDWLMARPFSLLGVDTPCIESARSRPDGSEETGHMLAPLFERGMLLLAPLVNLEQARAPRCQLIALPLNVPGVSGAPCRAVLIED